MSRWPTIVRCSRRTYQAKDERELTDLLAMLEIGDRRSARKYRVGPPPSRDGSLWACGDCRRRHRAWTTKCLVSGRPRKQANAA